MVQRLQWEPHKLTVSWAWGLIKSQMDLKGGLPIGLIGSADMQIQGLFSSLANMRWEKGVSNDHQILIGRSFAFSACFPSSHHHLVVRIG